MDDNAIENDELKSARAFELTNECIDFLVTLYKSQLRDKSHRFDQQAFDIVFSTTPTGSCPWQVTRETVYDNT